MTLTQQILTATINGLIFGGIFALTAVGLTLIFGILDVPNFAQGEFAAFAGYLAIALTGTLGLGPAAVLAIAATFVAGIAFERVLISPLYGVDDFLLKSFFVTFGVVIAFEQLLRNFFGSDFYQLQPPDLGFIVVGGVSVTTIRVVVGATSLVLIVGLYVFTRRTYVGLAMRAAADNPTGAEVTGINLDRINTFTFGLGAMLTGLTGILFALLFPLSPTTGIELTAFAFVIVVVGGVGSFGGTILASVLIGLVDNFTAVFIGSRSRFFVVFLLLLVILVIRPTGLRGDSS